MAHIRANFSDSQKADIFARDRATCCFSGKSLWLLDYQMTPLFDIDWADHIVPSSRGGQAIISNGVCASSFFNFKKRNNSADNTYFFECGKPTSAYFYFYGPLSSTLVSQLQRLSKLDSSDWYFNRCIFNIFLGLDYLARKERYSAIPKRSDIYWFKSAWKRLVTFHKITSSKSILSFEARGLLMYPKEKTTLNLLSIRDIHSEQQFLKFAYSLYPTFYLNFDLAEEFWEAETLEERKLLLKRAKSMKCSPLLYETLISHYTAEQDAAANP